MLEGTRMLELPKGLCWSSDLGRPSPGPLTSFGFKAPRFENVSLFLSQ